MFLFYPEAQNVCIFYKRFYYMFLLLVGLYVYVINQLLKQFAFLFLFLIVWGHLVKYTWANKYFNNVLFFFLIKPLLKLYSVLNLETFLSFLNFRINVFFS